LSMAGWTATSRLSDPTGNGQLSIASSETANTFLGCRTKSEASYVRFKRLMQLNEKQYLRLLNPFILVYECKNYRDKHRDDTVMEGYLQLKHCYKQRLNA